MPSLCYCCGQEFPDPELEEHHVSYKPEITIQVCKPCHEKIHHEDGFRPDLDPESPVQFDKENQTRLET